MSSLENREKLKVWQELLQFMHEHNSVLATVNGSGVAEYNQQGIDLMMRGKTTEALQLFIEAFKLSAGQLELAAQCLINIGDWLRRVDGDLQGALEIFKTVEGWPISLTTRSRLKCMEGMVYVVPFDAGEKTREKNPEDFRQHVNVMNAAINLAWQAEQAAAQAKVFATRRLSGSIADYGDKESFLEVIDELLPRLGESDDAQKFRYVKAMIIAEKNPLHAGELLVASARALHDSSPCDAYLYYALAAKYLLRANKSGRAVRRLGRECFENSKALFEKFGHTFQQDSATEKLLAELAKEFAE